MNGDISLLKQQVRREVAAIKSSFPESELKQFSSEVISHLEQTPEFKNADTLFIYYSMDDEVSTRELIQKYTGEKRIILPIVQGNSLLLRELTNGRGLEMSPYGIWEPKNGELFTDYAKINLAIIPGVAFDKQSHRLGRGKGYYDRLLPFIDAPKVGLCFDFQLKEAVPFEPNDIAMDFVISQSSKIKF